MGLRFRKSVKICDGLRLNFGKTGASVTVGNGPFKKTYNTNGNVTTTVGLPGTGIYWTETERRSSRSSRRFEARQQPKAPLLSPQNDCQVSPAVDDYFAQNSISENTDVVAISDPLVPVSVPTTSNTLPSGNRTSQASAEVPTKIIGLSADEIKRIYVYKDAPIDWTELIAGATADDLLMDPIVHSYCSQMAPKILSGDIDAYLEVIERLRPVDDLALYCGDFEFGTDTPTYIEVEFSTSPDRVLRNGTSDAMLEEFISAIAVRVARDLFALLPVAKVLVHVEINGNTVLSVIFIRNQLCGVNFRNESANAIVKSFPHQIVENNNYLDSVGRMQV